ncbi:MAG: hypothetical protein AAGB46_00095 [Verrucomicrobiota bacterium]
MKDYFNPLFSIAKLSLATLLGSAAINAQSGELDQYGGFMDIKGEKTGFFHTEKIDGRWWLVTPEGNAFWGIGMSHPVTGWTEGAVTFVYNGDQEAWFKDTVKRMKDLGYNCVWSGPYCPERARSGFIDKRLAEKVFKDAEIPYGYPVALIKHAVELEPGEKRPDVFSNEYKKFVQGEVEQHVIPNKDDPWIIGYYYGFGSFDRDWLWINDHLEKKGSPGRARLMSVLEDRYNGNISKLNQVYGTAFESFRALKNEGMISYPNWVTLSKAGRAKIPNTPEGQRIFEDAEALLGEIVEKVHALAFTEIRKHDTNHMILGCYVKEATYTEKIWRRIDPYIDVLAPQHVSEVFPIGPIVEALDKPAIISDQPYGNVYNNHNLVQRGAHGPVPDHVDRHLLYDLLTERISVDPDVTGANMCACLFDQSHWEKAYERGQPGFWTVDGEPRPHLIRTVQRSNSLLFERVKKSHDEETVQNLDEKFHHILSLYREVMDHRKEFLRRVPAIVYP